VLQRFIYTTANVRCYTRLTRADRMPVSNSKFKQDEPFARGLYCTQGAIGARDIPQLPICSTDRVNNYLQK
jgi:hypothetical protein